MAKKSLSSIFTIIMLIILGVSPVLAGDVVQIEPLTPAPSAETGVMTDETPQLWFVELTSAPTADGTLLPSSREGTLRTLLEAVAMAPIVSTDAVGCNEVVADAVNG